MAHCFCYYEVLVREVCQNSLENRTKGWWVGVCGVWRSLTPPGVLFFMSSRLEVFFAGETIANQSARLFVGAESTSECQAIGDRRISTEGQFTAATKH